MFDWLKSDWLKELQPRILFVIWFVGAVVLFAPAALAGRLGFTTVVDKYRGWIGIITLAGFALWCVEIWSWFYKRRAGRRGAQERRAQTLQYLQTLSPKEMYILVGCLACNQQTINLTAFEKAGAALRQKGLLVMASWGDAQNMPHTIPDFVWEHLQQHKDEILPKDEKELQALVENFRKFDSTAPWRRSYVEDW